MIKISRYTLIDKSFITEDTTLLFDLFELTEDERKVTPFLPKDTFIDADHKNTIFNARPLYIISNDRAAYDDYIALHFRTISRSSAIPFEEKSSILYHRAEAVMDKLFHDPESLGNIKDAQVVVDNIILTISSEDFTVQAMMEIAAHDYYTHTHSINVSIYALSLGQFMGIKDQELKELGEAALLHDLGKSKVHTEIINKNGKLTDLEFEEMMHHPAWGHKIALKMGIENAAILSGIRHHHEKLNGTGYPDKLTDEKITKFARIIAVCDVFDALTTRRSYKEPMTTFNAFKLIKNQMKGHLDMDIVNQFIRHLHATTS